MDSSHGPSFVQMLAESIDSLRLLGRRSVLALLGIAIGSAAIVALLNIGHSAAEEMMRMFKGMGTDILVVNFPAKPGDRPLPATLDTSAVRRNVPALTYVAPISLNGMTVRHAGRTANTTVVGTTSGLRSIIGLRLASGRFLSDFDHKSTFAVIGAQIAHDLEANGQPIKVGDRLQMGNYVFEVIGIAQSLQANSLIPIDVNQSIIIPIEGLRRVHPLPAISGIVAKALPLANLAATADILHRYLAGLFVGREVNVQIPQQLLDGLKRQSDTFSYLLAGLGGISLLVGGVGVMNVMLMNVAERRREIGLRMALGARPRDIRMLFLLEAANLALAGALLGAVFGLAAAYAFTRFSGWTFSLAPLALPLGIGSSLIIALFFGLYPAMAAAQLQPVQALRDA
ncbi:ABC transporter permease [Caballeronia sordidicola]|nr:ABC transporter permease [Caballeronia sordidicola]